MHDYRTTRPAIGRNPGSKCQQNLRGSRRHVDTWLLRYYDELCQMANSLLQQHGGCTNFDSAIALVHEAYLRLCSQEPVQWRNRRRFLGWTWQVMQWIINDQSRRRRAQKRGGLYQQVAWEDVASTLAAEAEPSEELIEALRLLRGAYPRRAAVVERRVFGGYTLHDTATQMGISVRTAEREWRKSKNYLRRVLEADTMAA